jgi:bifunctional non-homologous end joining protein LigD
VKTGRDIAAVAKGEAPAKAAPRNAKAPARKKAKTPADKMPAFVEPQLATLKPRTPTGKDWIHEIKFDGYRLQARIEKGKVALLTRNGHDWSGKFGTEVRKALAALPVKQAILDGELIVEGAGGASDFSALQADLSEGRSDRFRFVAFDLLHLDGTDLRDRPLLDRKATLETLLKDAPPPSAIPSISRKTARWSCAMPAA